MMFYNKALIYFSDHASHCVLVPTIISPELLKVTQNAW